MEIDRRLVPVDLFAFGSRSMPRAPRPVKDIPIDEAGMVGPEGGARPDGASTIGEPDRAMLGGHYHRLPEGTTLPEGLEVIADGQDVDREGPHPPTHHTIYPAVAMPYQAFVDLFLGLPWEYGGRK